MNKGVKLGGKATTAKLVCVLVFMRNEAEFTELNKRQDKKYEHLSMKFFQDDVFQLSRVYKFVSYNYSFCVKASASYITEIIKIHLS